MAARYAGDDDAAARAAALRARFLELADEDAEAYGAVLGSEGAEREAALSHAADVPLEVAEAAAEIAELAANLAREGNPNLRGDALSGHAVADAAARAAAQLVLINLEGRDDPRVERARELLR